MKIFVAGATGAVGKPLVSLLVSRGHHVIGTTRKPNKMSAIREAGAEPAIVDALDRNAVLQAVVSARPEVVVHQMTALASMSSLRRFDDDFAQTNRLRTEGTDHLLAAAFEAGAQRFVAQSYTGWPNERQGGRVKTEEDPLDANPPKSMTKTLEAIRRLETSVISASGLTGIVVRYGALYGPGTAIASGGEIEEAVRRRRFPIVGGGTGVWSFIHVDDAVSATMLAIEHGPSGVYNIVDDEPAEVSEWLPGLAQAIGAPTPHGLPGWIGRLVIGEAGVSMMTKARGSSNAKAKRVLNWQPVSDRDEMIRRGIVEPANGVQ
jgi:nucleoside-diphosphate-sugar epimerase